MKTYTIQFNLRISFCYRSRVDRRVAKLLGAFRAIVELAAYQFLWT